MGSDYTNWRANKMAELASAWAFEELKAKKNRNINYSDIISDALELLDEDFKCGKASEEDIAKVVDVINKKFRDWISIYGQKEKVNGTDEFGFISFD
jgi:hypothetical protein